MISSRCSRSCRLGENVGDPTCCASACTSGEPAARPVHLCTEPAAALSADGCRVHVCESRSASIIINACRRCDIELAFRLRLSGNASEEGSSCCQLEFRVLSHTPYWRKSAEAERESRSLEVATEQDCLSAPKLESWAALPAWIAGALSASWLLQSGGHGRPPLRYHVYACASSDALLDYGTTLTWTCHNSIHVHWAPALLCRWF